MPETWIGMGNTAKRLVDPVVGTADGMKSVQKIWAGSADGTPVLVFERFVASTVSVRQTTDKRWDQLVVSWTSLGVGVVYTVKQGTRIVAANTSSLTVTDSTGLLPSKSYTYTVEAFRNGVKVGGGEGTGSTAALTLTLSVSVVSWSSLKVSWNGVPGLTDWKVLRGASSGSAGHTKVKDETDETATSYTDAGLSANTTYYYTLQAIRNGAVIAQTAGTHSATTNARGTVPKDTGAILAESCGSYKGGSASPSWGLREKNTRMWIGYGDQNKDQHSGAFFRIPAAVRSSVSVTKVWVSFRVQWVSESNKQWPLVVMVNPKDGSWPSTWPGSTGRFAYPVARARDTWLGSHPGEWMEITNLVAPGWGSIKDLVKNGSLVGIGFAPDSNSGYGYANFSTAPDIRPRLLVEYTEWEA